MTVGPSFTVKVTDPWLTVPAPEVTVAVSVTVWSVLLNVAVLLVAVVVVAALFTVCATDPLLGANGVGPVVVPLYAALIVWLPAASADVVHVACPLAFRGCAPHPVIGVAASLNATVPSPNAGFPAPVPVPVTVAVKVTD